MKNFPDFPEAFDYCRRTKGHPITVLVAGKKYKLFPSGHAEDLDPTMTIVFGFNLSGPGTTLTHAAHVPTGQSHPGGTKTLCGKDLTPDWYCDADWADGPECKHCKSALEVA